MRPGRTKVKSTQKSQEVTRHNWYSLIQSRGRFEILAFRDIIHKRLWSASRVEVQVTMDAPTYLSVHLKIGMAQEAQKSNNLFRFSLLL